MEKFEIDADGEKIVTHLMEGMVKLCKYERAGHVYIAILNFICKISVYNNIEKELLISHLLATFDHTLLEKEKLNEKSGKNELLDRH